MSRRAAATESPFGLAETVFTPLFMRFGFLACYEGYETHSPSIGAAPLVGRMIGLMASQSIGQPKRTVFELTKNPHTAGGALGTMVPWFLTIGIVGAFGLTVGLTGAADWMIKRVPHGNLVLGIVTFLMILAGLVVTVRRSFRPSRSELALHITPEDLLLARVGGDRMVALGWNDISAKPVHYTTLGRYSVTVPVLELNIILPGGSPLRVSPWDGRHRWQFETARVWRVPRYLIDPDAWLAFLEALYAKGVVIQARS